MLICGSTMFVLAVVGTVNCFTLGAYICHSSELSDAAGQLQLTLVMNGTWMLELDAAECNGIGY
jgi:hypothetical protein